MKYKTMIKLHELSHAFWELWTLNRFHPKEEYTIFDLLSFIPGIIGTKLIGGVDWLYKHRKRWVIAKKPKESTP